MTAVSATATPKRAWTKGRIATHVFLAIMTAIWLIPLVYALLALSLIHI